MTYKDIFTKFMIEYDKANITSSYPSLTDYEIATILDKSYLALINQKITGNNVRKIPFEGDGKSIEDLQGLIVSSTLTSQDAAIKATNELVFNYPSDMLYYVQSMCKIGKNTYSVVLANHNIAEKYKESANNKPTLKSFIAYLQNNLIRIIYDSYTTASTGNLIVTYIKQPLKFTPNETNDFSIINGYVFELSDSMVEELISLAIIFALDNVESTRLKNKTELIPLEA